jgi:hypothetical protein
MKVLIVGDSQAAGPPGAAVERILRSEGQRVVRIGHSGHGAADWSRMHWDQYRAALRDLSPDDVILIFGSNDPANDALRDALRRFKDSAGRVWYAGPPRYRDSTAQTRGSGIRAMVREEFGDRFLDAYPYTGEVVPRAPDGLHFTRAGGDVWGAGIVRDWKQASRGQLLTGSTARERGFRIAMAMLGASVLFAGAAWAWSSRGRGRS